MKDCLGLPLTSSILDDLPKRLASSISEPSCCRVYDINWSGREVRDITCAYAKSKDNCQVNIKIFRASILRNCFENGLQEVARFLLKNNFILKGKFLLY